MGLYVLKLSKSRGSWVSAIKIRYHKIGVWHTWSLKTPPDPLLVLTSESYKYVSVPSNPNKYSCEYLEKEAEQCGAFLSKQWRFTQVPGEGGGLSIPHAQNTTCTEDHISRYHMHRRPHISIPHAQNTTYLDTTCTEYQMQNIQLKLSFGNILVQ